MSEEPSAPSWGTRLWRALRRLLALACCVVAAWLLCWTVYLGALWWAGLGALVLWWRGLFPTAMYGLLGLFLVPLALVRYDQRSQHLSAAVRSGGPAALSTADLSGIYGLNLLMGTTGYVLGFREVGLETLRMALPGPSTQRWEDARFPVCAPRVAEVVERRRQQAAKGREGPWADRVVWTGYISSAEQSTRAGLALNPVEVRSSPDGDELVVEATVPVDYPPSARTLLATVGPFEVAVEEGLFHAAEERGWLHPFQLTWVVRVPLDGAMPPPCEAWSVRLAAQISTAAWP